MNSWPSNTAVETVSEEDRAKRIKRENDAIATWIEQRAKLAHYKLSEMNARTQVTGLLFPTPKKGTQRFPLAGGYNIKLVHVLIYDLGEKGKLDDSGLEITVEDQVLALEDKIAKLGEVAEVLLPRLIKWKPELSATEYTKLDPGHPIEGQIKNLIDEILTVRPGSPQLEFEEPKVKK